MCDVLNAMSISTHMIVCMTLIFLCYNLKFVIIKYFYEEPHKVMHYFSLTAHIRQIFATRPDLVKLMEYPQTRKQPPQGTIGKWDLMKLVTCEDYN